MVSYKFRIEKKTFKLRWEKCQSLPGLNIPQFPDHSNPGEKEELHWHSILDGT